MKPILKYFAWTLVIVLIGWFILTLYVEGKGPEKEASFGTSGKKKVLIVFDPDPFYNLDEQVCASFAKALAENNMSVKLASVTTAEKIQNETFDLYVYCANTYNWRPDWAITGFIEDQKTGKTDQIAVAITLGAGSTEFSQKSLENIIINSGWTLMGSYSLWLWRPNNKEKIEQPNVEVAVAMAYDWGIQIAIQINKQQ